MCYKLYQQIADKGLAFHIFWIQDIPIDTYISGSTDEVVERIHLINVV